jgi:ADP-ribosylglycohydrolase
MITRYDLAKDDARKRDKAYATLIGLAIGDSFGDQARTPENHILHGISMDLYGESSWSTDDTEFMLLTADTLIKTKGSPTVEDVVEQWKKHCFPQSDLGPKGGESEIGAVANLKRGIMPPRSGEENTYHYSDGAAMRIAPVGVACAGDPAEAARIAEIDACISHYRDGIWGAQAIAASVAVAMVDGTVDEIIQAGLDVVPEGTWLRNWMEKGLAICEEAGGVLEKAWDRLHSELFAVYRACTAEAVSEAYAIFKLTEGDFERGIIYSGNFGRDADTVCAIVGAFSGAMHGTKPIRNDWIEKTRHPSGRCLEFTAELDIEQVAEELAQLIR